MGYQRQRRWFKVPGWRWVDTVIRRWRTGRWLIAANNPRTELLSSEPEEQRMQFRALQEKMRLSNLVVTIVLLVLFAGVPIVIFLARQQFNFSSADPMVYNLYFGGSNRDFLVGLNQWWRLFTFPFPNASLVLVIWYGLVLYGVAKTSEVYLPRWKLVVCVGAGYPLIGLVLSLCLPGLVVSSSITIIFLIFGCTVVAGGEDHSAVAAFVRRYQSLLVGVGLLLIPLFTGSIA